MLDQRSGQHIPLDCRIGIGLMFASTAIAGPVLSYTFGELLTKSPNAGLHIYSNLWTMLIWNAPKSVALMVWGVILAPLFFRLDLARVRDTFIYFSLRGILIFVLATVTSGIMQGWLSIANIMMFAYFDVFTLILCVICGNTVGWLMKPYWLRGKANTD